MGIRFRKSINLGPLRINLSKSGISYSFGFGGIRASKLVNKNEKITINSPVNGLFFAKEKTNPKNDKKILKFGILSTILFLFFGRKKATKKTTSRR